MIKNTCYLALLALACILPNANSVEADVVINEWNAVRGDRFLDGGDGSDSFFGTVEGNGGNWLELVVVGGGFGTTVDMRGWQLQWGEDEDENGSYSATELGVINFTNNSFWSSVESGTIITIIETSDGAGSGFDTSTNTSYDDPTTGDYHVNISTLEESLEADPLLIADSGENVAADDGEFSVGHNDWFGMLLDGTGSTVFGPVGEGEASYAGDSINSREVGKLEAPVTGSLADWLAITPGSDFDDGGTSTFGSANTWSDGASIQNFSALRAVPEPGTAGIVLLALAGFSFRRRKN